MNNVEICKTLHHLYTPMAAGGERGERPFTYYTKKISLSSFREKTRRLRIFS